MGGCGSKGKASASEPKQESAPTLIEDLAKQETTDAEKPAAAAGGAPEGATEAAPATATEAEQPEGEEDDLSKAVASLRSLFDKIDKDEDGKLSSKELSALLKTETELDSLLEKSGLNSSYYVFEQLDSNEDGQVSWDEFMTSLVKGAAEAAAAQEPPVKEEEKVDDAAAAQEPPAKEEEKGEQAQETAASAEVQGLQDEPQVQEEESQVQEVQAVQDAATFDVKVDSGEESQVVAAQKPTWGLFALCQAPCHVKDEE